MYVQVRVKMFDENIRGFLSRILKVLEEYIDLSKNDVKWGKFILHEI